MSKFLFVLIGPIRTVGGFGKKICLERPMVQSEVLTKFRLYDTIGSARNSSGFIPTIHFSRGIEVEAKSDLGISVVQVESKQGA